MIGGEEPRISAPWEHDVCQCGRQKRTGSNLCYACHSERRAREADAILQAEKMDRHRRFTAALEVGWTFQELVEMRPNLPTREEIDRRRVREMIKEWWNAETMAQ